MSWRIEEAEKRRREWEKNEKRGEKKKEKKGEGQGGKKVRLSKQNQMQECGGSFDLDPHRLIDVAHFISLSKS